MSRIPNLLRTLRRAPLGVPDQGALLRDAFRRHATESSHASVLPMGAAADASMGAASESPAGITSERHGPSILTTIAKALALGLLVAALFTGLVVGVMLLAGEPCDCHPVEVVR